MRPAVSNDPVAVYGMPTAIAARAAARISSGADIVSIHATSAPPATRPRICSVNTSTASSSVSAPSGANSSPVGPTDPATTTGRGAASATSRASSAARLVELEHAVLGVVQLQPVPVAAERVREDDVGARVDERPVQLLHPFGMVDVPELGRLARLEAHLEVVRAGRAVGEQHPARCQECFE